jgi:hypothetical protein
VEKNLNIAALFVLGRFWCTEILRGLERCCWLFWKAFARCLVQPILVNSYLDYVPSSCLTRVVLISLLFPSRMQVVDLCPTLLLMLASQTWENLPQALLSKPVAGVFSPDL